MSEQIDVLDHGCVRLVDHMGSDLSVVRAARVSYDADWRAGEDHGSDARLISYLWKPADKAPFEAVQFRMLGKRNKAGWPLYDAYNLGTKPIEFLAIDLYGYDASGKQVVKTSPPLSWNGKLAPGGKTDWELDIGGFGDPIPATAVTFQACYSGIKLEGADTINDFARCPDQRPLAK